MILSPFMLSLFVPTLWIVSSLPPEKELLSSDGSFLFRQVFKKLLSGECNESGRKVHKDLV